MRMHLHDESPTQQALQLAVPHIARSYMDTEPAASDDTTTFGIDPFDVLAHKEEITQTTTYTLVVTTSPGRKTGTLHISRKTIMNQTNVARLPRTFKLTALADLKRVMPRFSATNYDPRVHTADLLRTDWAKATAASSLAWRLDNVLVNTARSLFFSIFQQMLANGSVESYTEFLDKANGGNIDHVNDMIASIKERSEADETMHEQGLSPRDLVDTIDTILLLRQDWHAYAMDACGFTTGSSSVLGVRHTEPSLDRLFIDQKAQNVAPATREKMRLSADMAAVDEETGVIDEEAAEEIFKSKEKRAQAQAADQLEQGQKRIPAMLSMLRYISMYSTRSTATFEDLPLATRKRFIENMISMFDSLKTQSENAPARFVTSDDHEINIMDARRAVKAIKQILCEPVFTEDGDNLTDIESQQMINAKRRQSEEAEARAEGFVNDKGDALIGEYRAHLRTLGSALHHPAARPNAEG